MDFEELSHILFVNEIELIKFFKDSHWSCIEEIEDLLDIEFAYTNGIFASDIEDDPDALANIEEYETIDWNSYRKKKSKELHYDVLGFPEKYPVILLYHITNDDIFVGKYIYYRNIVEARLAYKLMNKEK